MGHAEPHPLHRLDHRRGRRGAAGRDLDDVVEAALHLVGRVHQHVEHDRRAAQMGDAMLGDRGEDRRRDRPGAGRHACRRPPSPPRIGPAVAVEHRQGPQIDRWPVEPEGDRIAERVQKGAAMMIDDALGIAGGAGGVVERDRPIRRRAAATAQRDRRRRETPRNRSRPERPPSSADRRCRRAAMSRPQLRERRLDGRRRTRGRRSGPWSRRGRG